MKILIISPEKWGTMKVSKHHYAQAFSAMGHSVTFLNPFSERQTQRTSDAIEVITITKPFWYNIKFHLLPLYRYLITRTIKKYITESYSIILSFDIAGDFPLDKFKTPYKLLFAADLPRSEIAMQSIYNADYCISVAQTILDAFPSPSTPRLLLNHGLSPSFTALSTKEPTTPRPIRKVGYSGNLLRPDIDFISIKTVVSMHPEINFHFWGAYDKHQANLGGATDSPFDNHLAELQAQPNTIFHGAVSHEVLADEYEKIDAFWICYDPNKDQSKSANYHKIMEYLASGKVIITNKVREYEGNSLLAQSSSYEHNNDFAELFNTVTEEFQYWNSYIHQAKRKAFAQLHRYEHLASKILTLTQPPKA